MRTIDYFLRAKLYLYEVLLTVSILLNVIGGGSMNQTFSARNYGWKKEKRFNLVWVIDAIFYYSSIVLNKLFPKVFPISRNHCMDAWVYWYVRKHCLDQHCTNNIIMEQVNNGQIDFGF